MGRFIYYTILTTTLLFVCRYPFGLLAKVSYPNYKLAHTFTYVLLYSPGTTFCCGPITPLLFIRLTTTLYTQLILGGRVPRLVIIVTTMVGTLTLFTT